MKLLLAIQKKILPELLEVMSLRYRILRFINLMQPIGRRSLSTSLAMSERVLRGEVTNLKNRGLLEITGSGMTLTEQGESVLTELEAVMKEVFDLKRVERQIKQILKLSEVIIIPGDSDQDPWVKKEIGRATVQLMKHHIADEKEKIVVLTGGTTVAAVADMMTPDGKMAETLFVPARGGLGGQVENQANTICAVIAKKAMGNYRLLHVPDQLSIDSYNSLMEEPEIKKILKLIRSSNMIVHGIGEAKSMSEQRNSPNEVLQSLVEKKAVAEAFGYYFNQKGEIIHKILTIGLKLEDVMNMETVVAVAGGTSKAEAILAYMKQKTSTILVTDEGAAKGILKAVQNIDGLAAFTKDEN